MVAVTFLYVVSVRKRYFHQQGATVGLRPVSVLTQQDNMMEVPPAVGDTVIFGGSASEAGGMVGANVEDHNKLGGGG